MSKKDSNILSGLALESLHHAYFLVGEARAAEEAVLGFFEEKGLPLKGSSDFFVFKETLLGIDDARKLSEQAIRRAFGERKIFFLAPERITLEAQNALLKTFEEPIPNTHFFLVLRDENLVIPTLHSRVHVLRLGNEASLRSEAKKFLGGSIKERLAFVKKFVDAEKNLSRFLDELLLELKQKGNTDSVGKVYRLRLSSDDRAASPRLILEHLAVSL
jgi:hypothetical protein